MHVAKAITAVIATIASAIVAGLAEGVPLSPAAWINVAVLGVGAASVYIGPNVAGASVVKAALAFLTAVLTLAVNLIAEGITLAEWLQLVVAGLNAIGVYAVPNKRFVGKHTVEPHVAPEQS